MHPLVLPKRGGDCRQKSPRITWVHTLCASFVCSYKGTAGCVYGCFADGSYDVESNLAETGEDDASSVESDAANYVPVVEKDLSFFALAGKYNGADTPWSRAVKEHCSELKCYICGQENEDCRIPIQCTALDEEVIVDVNNFRLSFNEYSGCFAAMHVGELLFVRVITIKEADSNPHMAILLLRRLCTVGASQEEKTGMLRESSFQSLCG